MLQLWTIALVLILGVDEAIRAQPQPGASAPSASLTQIGISLVPFLVIAACVWFVCARAARIIDATGSTRPIAMADRVVSISRPLIVATFAISVLALDLTAHIRALAGMPDLLVHAAAMLVPLAAFVFGWWCLYPIDRRIAHAAMLRALDDGRPVHAAPTRTQYVIARVRQELLLLLVPLLLVGAWSEAVQWGMSTLARSQDAKTLAGWRWLADPDARALVQAGVQFLGVVAVFVFAPAILRRVWDTVRLGEGPLRDELLDLCRVAGVKVRDILVWRTHHVVVNGAAMGLVPRFRYILLTDALLETLPRRQLHAVMAHEIGHVKHRHIPWLVMSLIASSGLTVFAAAFLLGFVDDALAARIAGFVASPAAQAWMTWSNIGVMILAIATGIVTLGLVSRRFEWQADAFAAAALSRDESSSAVSTSSVDAMAGALQSVADHAHIPTTRSSFRHGSIASRQRRLASLIGIPLDRMPIDRAARRVKIATLLGLSLLIAAAVFDHLSASHRASHSVRTAASSAEPTP